MHSAYKSVQNLFPLIVILPLVMLVNCNASESQPVLATNSATPLSLSNTWKMRLVKALIWHPTNNLIAFAGTDEDEVRGTYLYDVQSGQKLYFIDNGSLGAAGGIVFAPDGNSIATTSFYGGLIQMAKTANGAEVVNLVSDNCSAGHWLFFNPTGDALLTGLGSGHIDWKTTLNLWDIRTGSCQQLQKRPGFLGFLDVNDSFNHVLMSMMLQEQEIYLWDLDRQIDTCHLLGNFGLFVPLTNQFVVSNEDKLSFYDVSSCQMLQEFTIAPPFYGYVAFSPNGELFVTAGKNLQVWKSSTGELLFQEELPENFFGAHSHPSLVFSPNGQYLSGVFSVLKDDEVNAIIQVWQVEYHSYGNLSKQ